jgi:Skp family chaperone for outer membrane proteins
MKSSWLSSPTSLFALALFLNSLAGFPATSQESIPDSPSLRLAVIDLAKAFESHPETATAAAQLTKDRAAAREVFKEKSEALKKVLQAHSELIRAGKKTEAAEKLKEANELEKAIATLRTTQQRDLEEKFKREKNRIIDAIRVAVREYNAEKKYTVVLDKSAESAFGVPAVIDASGSDDITEAIISRLKTES